MYFSLPLPFSVEAMKKCLWVRIENKEKKCAFQQNKEKNQERKNVRSRKWSKREAKESNAMMEKEDPQTQLTIDLKRDRPNWST